MSYTCVRYLTCECAFAYFGGFDTAHQTYKRNNVLNKIVPVPNKNVASAITTIPAFPFNLEENAVI